MPTATGVFLLCAAAPLWAASAEPAIDWDADPMPGLRALLRSDKRQAAAAEFPQAAELPPSSGDSPANEESPVFVRTRSAPAKPARRDFSRPAGAKSPDRSVFRPLIPIGPACADGSDPPCRVETPPPAGSPPRGGYYYGHYRGPDGKLVFGKLYLPHYGPFDGYAHNDPPANPVRARLILENPSGSARSGRR